GGGTRGGAGDGPDAVPGHAALRAAARAGADPLARRLERLHALRRHLPARADDRPRARGRPSRHLREALRARARPGTAAPVPRAGPARARARGERPPSGVTAAGDARLEKPLGTLSLYSPPVA